MLCIFNPEHDLCLANGNKHYIPPMSALEFAAKGCQLMSYLYPDAVCLPVSRVGEVCRHIEEYGFRENMFERIVPWGWNLSLKYALIKQGIPETIMPSDTLLAQWRTLQHRSTLLPLQPQSHAATTMDETILLVAQFHSVVMKAPWSGAGRGLRWVKGRLSDHDVSWFKKVVREQQCVIVEPYYCVAADFALEYCIDGDGLHFRGYSLFDSTNGVYHGNLLLSDEAIRQNVGVTDSEQQRLEDWLEAHIVPYYQGPLGVDLILDTDGNRHISEINLRHTMGWVAHEYLLQHPEMEGAYFIPMDVGSE